MARIAIIGAGVVGVASAWMLARAGHSVTLIDRHLAPARGASFANGAQLSYAYGDALASPALLRKMPAILLGRDPAFNVRMQADPEFFLWGVRFVANALPSAFRANTRALLELAAVSKSWLPEVIAETGIAFDHAPSGKMILHASVAECDGAADLRVLKSSLGITQHVLDRADATAIEPALGHYPDNIARVVWSPDDAAGRPDAFCHGLVEQMRTRYALKTLFGAESTSILRHRDEVRGVAFVSREPVECDVVIAACGASVSVLPRADRLWSGILGGLWPVQGYSLTAPATPAAMRVSITDLKRKIVFARLGEEVRAAGLADIGPRRSAFDERRFATFRSQAVAAFGPAFDHGAGTGHRAWTGGRPCTPSSQPIIRAASLKGLYLNLGHGTLGWTLALGSAARVAELVKLRS
jgi:D-amino-acid dehydrogenase